MKLALTFADTVHTCIAKLPHCVEYKKILHVIIIDHLGGAAMATDLGNSIDIFQGSVHSLLEKIPEVSIRTG